MKCPPEMTEILGEILQFGFLRIRAYGWKGDAKQCAVEADHLHNLPLLLSDFSEELLEFYSNVERAAFLRQANADAATAFASLWQRLERCARKGSAFAAGG